MSPAETLALSLVANKSEALVVAIVALVRDALEGQPAEVIVQRAERLAVLNGHHALIESRAEARKAELAAQVPAAEPSEPANPEPDEDNPPAALPRRFGKR